MTTRREFLKTVAASAIVLAAPSATAIDFSWSPSTLAEFAAWAESQFTHGIKIHRPAVYDDEASLKGMGLGPWKAGLRHAHVAQINAYLTDPDAWYIAAPKPRSAYFTFKLGMRWDRGSLIAGADKRAALASSEKWLCNSARNQMTLNLDEEPWMRDARAVWRSYPWLSQHDEFEENSRVYSLRYRLYVTEATA